MLQATAEQQPAKDGWRHLRGSGVSAALTRDSIHD